MAKDYSKNAAIGRRVKKTADNVFGWMRDLNAGEIDYSKPVILCLPGDGAQTERKSDGSVDDAKAANGMAKVVMQMLRKIGEGIASHIETSDFTDIQVIAVEYPDAPRKYIGSTAFSKERKYFVLKKNNRLDCEDNDLDNPTYITDIYETVVLPAISNNGKPYSFEQAKSNLRNLTLFGHCHGSFVASKLVEYLTEDMKKLGYNNIPELLNEVVKISISPCLGTLINDGTQHYAFTLLDDTERGYYPYDRKNLYEEKIKTFGICLDIGDENEEEDKNVYSFYVGEVMDKIPHEVYEMHDLGAYIDEGYMLDAKGKTLRGGLFGGIGKNENGENFSRLIKRVLENAVSLSKMNESRSLNEVVSDGTRIVYQHFSDAIQFDGSIGEFIANDRKFDEYEEKKKQLELATQKLETMQNKVDVNLADKMNGRE